MTTVPNARRATMGVKKIRSSRLSHRSSELAQLHPPIVMAGPVPAILAPAGETQMAEADFDRPDHNESSRESAS
jgi:hypothetical protein